MNYDEPEKPVDAFVVGPDPCVYFPDRVAHAIVVESDDDIKPTVYSHLAQAGFRRTGSTFYVPDCDGCNACVPLRVVAGAFRPNRRFRRVLARNDDLDLDIVDAQDEVEEHFALYRRYIAGRHPGGSMDPPSAKQFLHLTQSYGVETLALDWRKDGMLVASAITDVLDHGLAAVYTFFDPQLADRSLGVLAILHQIAECQRRGLPYLYLGYWLEEVRKMRYKSEYRPAEVLRGGDWLPLELAPVGLAKGSAATSSR